MESLRGVKKMDAQTNVTSTGQKIRTVDITVTAAMAALVFLGTYIFKIPTISGYVHLGDCMILLTVALFGMKKGAIAGMVTGGLTVIIWDYIPLVGGQTLGSYTGLYSLAVGFLLSLVMIVIVSLVTKAPSKEITDEFDRVAAK